MVQGVGGILGLQCDATGTELFSVWIVITENLKLRSYEHLYIIARKTEGIPVIRIQLVRR